MSVEKTHLMQGIRFLVGATIAAGTILPFQQTALAQDKAKIEAGEDIYNTYCSTCHGDKLVSSGQTFDLRRLTSNDRSRFQNSVLIGKNQMPPWKGALTDDEIDLIWHFIRDNAYEK